MRYQAGKMTTSTEIEDELNRAFERQEGLAQTALRDQLIRAALTEVLSAGAPAGLDVAARACSIADATLKKRNETAGREE